MLHEKGEPSLEELTERRCHLEGRSLRTKLRARTIEPKVPPQAMASETKLIPVRLQHLVGT